MRKTRKCAFCGKEFTCNSGSQRYCSEHCAEAAKAQRKKRQQDFLKAIQPVIDIASQEYLTFSKAAILMGCSRQYVYKLVNEGKLPASRISNRTRGNYLHPESATGWHSSARQTSRRCLRAILITECCSVLRQTSQARNHPIHHLLPFRREKSITTYPK